MEIKSRSKRGDIAGGLILVLIGIVFLIWQLAPELVSSTLGINFTWPLLIVGMGLIFLLAGIITLQGGFLVPAAVLGGIGSILYYQNTTGDWASWAYIWALIPGFCGVWTAAGKLHRPLNAGCSQSRFHHVIDFFGRYRNVRRILHKQYRV
jgi:hypothetical protein